MQSSGYQQSMVTRICEIGKRPAVKQVMDGDKLGLCDFA